MSRRRWARASVKLLGFAPTMGLDVQSGTLRADHQTRPGEPFSRGALQSREVFSPIPVRTVSS